MDIYDIHIWFRDSIITLRLRISSTIESKEEKKIGFTLTQYFMIFIAIFYMHTALINNWSYLLSILTTNLLNILDYLMDSRNVTLQIDWIIVCCYLLSFGFFSFLLLFSFSSHQICVVRVCNEEGRWKLNAKTLSTCSMAN